MVALHSSRVPVEVRTADEPVGLLPAAIGWVAHACVRVTIFCRSGAGLRSHASLEGSQGGR